MIGLRQELEAIRGSHESAISELKRAEKAMRESEIRFEKLSTHVPGMIYMFKKRPDNTYCVPFTTEGIREIFGCSPEDVKNDFSPIARVILPDDIGTVVSSIEHSAASMTTWQCEYRVQVPGYPVRWLHGISTPEKSGDGSITWYGFNTDITERKKVEQSLIKAKEKAQESDRLKSAFLANMSHEIRTPMNAIVGFSALLSEPDCMEEERGKFSSIIQSRSDDLMRIINDLLEISRIESGNATVTKESISLNALVDEMETIFSQRIKSNKRSNLKIISEKVLRDSDAIITTDGYIIKQVYSNLIDNAIKYTDSGLVQFGYQKPEDNMITCYVQDTGIGITPENQHLIFESFRQAETSDRYRYGGTGLGLSICKGALALIGGSIWVESTPGEGSVFYFRIPFELPVTIHRDPVAGEPAPARPQGEPLSLSGKQFLVVEDEESNMEYLSILFNHTGAGITWAITGSEVRAIYPELDKFDLVLLDIRLPDASGWDLVKEIKQRRPELPVLAQTAYAMQSDRIRSEEAGCDGYISKPIRRTELFQVIEKILQKP